MHNEAANGENTEVIKSNSYYPKQEIEIDYDKHWKNKRNGRPYIIKNCFETNVDIDVEDDGINIVGYFLIYDGVFNEFPLTAKPTYEICLFYKEAVLAQRRKIWEEIDGNNIPVEKVKNKLGKLLKIEELYNPYMDDAPEMVKKKVNQEDTPY